LRHLYIKTIILPRQARDKHRESTQKRTFLSERFYEPDSGKILVDGQPIEEYDVHHWRRSLAIVSQENVLFDKTIKENILYVSSGLVSHLHPTHT
jgi:ABC-type transport system involved in Fe-S cluster assembly fused permease/ATPase subunit